MINKLLITVFTLFSLSCFGSKLGSNSLGFGLGMLEYGVEGNERGVKTDYDVDGFAFGLGGNLNIISLENSAYGLDATFAFIQGLELGPFEGVEADVTSLNLFFKPYTKVGDVLLFANLGIGYSEIEAYTATQSVSEDDTAFAAGFGAEFELNKLIVSPALTWIFVGDNAYSSDFDLSEQLQLSVPVSYSINEKLDVSFSFNHTFVDEYSFTDSTGTYTYDPYVQSWFVGIEYKY